MFYWPGGNRFLFQRLSVKCQYQLTSCDLFFLYSTGVDGKQAYYLYMAMMCRKLERGSFRPYHIDIDMLQFDFDKRNRTTSKWPRCEKHQVERSILSFFKFTSAWPSTRNRTTSRRPVPPSVVVYNHYYPNCRPHGVDVNSKDNNGCRGSANEYTHSHRQVRQEIITLPLQEEIRKCCRRVFGMLNAAHSILCPVTRSTAS